MHESEDKRAEAVEPGGPPRSSATTAAQPPSQSPGSTAPGGWPALALVALVAALPLFWKLGTRALWQDEAACAVMSRNLLETGKPLAYDGRNLITMDEFQPEEGPGLAGRTGDPAVAVQYYVDKGDFKPDTTWIGQPWGQFVTTAVSFALLGEGTLQARLPFALAGVLTAVALFAFVRRRMGGSVPAALAVLFVLGSTYWVLHVRQCRYYGTSTLFLVLTVVSYFRWQERRGLPGSRVLAAAFVFLAWGYFQNDFGSFWPVMGVLTVDALLSWWRGRSSAEREGFLATFVPFAFVGLAVLPFTFYYELFVFEDGSLGSGRFKKPAAPWDSRLGILLVYLNQFQFPLVLAPFTLALCWLRREVPGRRIALVCLGIVFGQTAWMTLVSPFPFYRYLVDMTPLSSLLVAWTLWGWMGIVFGGRQALGNALAAALALVVLVTPLAPAVARPLIPVPELIDHILPPTGTLVRHELGILVDDLDQRYGDPNGKLVRYLEDVLRPGDEVVVNYEDAPLMFYLENKVRGGIACFRAEDDPPPRFLILRQSVGFTHGEVYQRIGNRYQWRRHETGAPDVTWGNNPDPWCHVSRQLEEVGKWGTLEVLENMGPKQ